MKFNSIRTRVVPRNWLAGCCALLAMSLACAVLGQQRGDVRTAFLDRAADEELTPPTPPNPPRNFESIENGSVSGGGSVIESSRAPGMNSYSVSAGEFYYGGYGGQGYGGPGYGGCSGCQNGGCYCHGCNGCNGCCCHECVHPCPYCPVAGAWQRKWVTQVKPHLQASHWGYPEYFEERPFGSYTIQAEQMQAINGLRDQQVLYYYDFNRGDQAGTLSPRGEYQLRKIVRRMQIVPGPVVIQTSVIDPQLDEARKQSVFEALQSAGVPASPDMVVVDHPPLPGLQGLEATFIYGNLLRQTQDRGGGFDFEGGGGFGAPINIGNVSVSPSGGE